MDLRPQPETDHDYLISLWVFLVGTNGDGLLGKFEKFTARTDERLDAVEKKLPGLWTREEHAAAEKAAEECDDRRKDRRKISAREWMLIAMTIIGPIVAVIIAHFVK